MALHRLRRETLLLSIKWTRVTDGEKGAERRNGSQEAERSGSGQTLEGTDHTRSVYSWCMSKMRTNIEIENDYLQTIMDRYGIHTKTEAVDLALRNLAGQPMTREEALAMHGSRAIGKIPADTGPSSS